MTDSLVLEIAVLVFEELGSGLTEYIYQNALACALRARGCRVESEVVLPIRFADQIVGYMRQDLVVDGSICVELKAKNGFTSGDHSQAKAYLRHNTDLSSTILINFGASLQHCVYDVEKG